MKRICRHEGWPGAAAPMDPCGHLAGIHVASMRDWVTIKGHCAECTKQHHELTEEWHV